MSVYKNTGEIDGLFYRTYTWVDGEKYSAQTCISRNQDLRIWEIGESTNESIEDAMHLSVWDAYKNYVKRYGVEVTPRAGVGG